MVNLFDGHGKIVHSSAIDFDYQRCDVVVCFLSLLFISKSKRSDLIKKIKDRLKIGGVLIVVDKMSPVGGYISTVLYRLTLNQKLKTTSAEDILKKELSLAGVQTPLDEIEQSQLGVEFFRFGDFAGFVYEKSI